MKKIRVGLLGCGTVGTGVYELIQKNQDKYSALLGAEVEIVKIVVHSLDKKRPSIPTELLTVNPEDVLENKDIDVVVEVMGGVTDAKAFVMRALENKKHVVTANKDLMAVYGQTLFELGDKEQKLVLFEASVAGALPVIGTIKNDLAGNKISKVMGIVNGTTNFILTKMFDEGLPLDIVLKEAQDLGYAEADPTADVEGLDAARKIAILASISFNSRVVLDDVYVEGITKIATDDIQYAKQFNSTIKLLGIALVNNGSIEVRVHPTLIPLSHPLAKVDDVYNAIYLEGDAFGDLTILGKGAGGLPTASAVVGDILSIGKTILNPVSEIKNCTCYLDLPIKTIKQVETHYYIRMTVADETGVLSKIANVFAENNVSIDSVIQKKLDNNQAELVLLTDRVEEDNFMKAKAGIEDLEKVHCVTSILRAEKEN